MPSPIVKLFFHKATNTGQYVVSCPNTKEATIIDSVLDYEPASARISEESVNEIVKYVDDEKLKVTWILDTHMHADHLTGMATMKRRFPDATTGIGSRIVDVIKTFRPLFDVGDDVPSDGSQFDRLFNDGDTFNIGELKARVVHTPGHTPACVTYFINDAAFCGDTIFMPDSGSARCDFPGGSGETLYHSVRDKLYSLPEDTKLYVGHDYGNDGKRDVQFQTTIEEEKKTNKHIKENTQIEEFLPLRTARDQTLGAPRLLIPSLQVNIRAGNLPKESANGRRYLKFPLNVF